MDNIKKFQELLKELFQFETSDLDFGIYRILNYKRDQIKKFIQEDLVNKVESAFAKHKDKRLTNINHRFEEAKEKIIQSLGKEAFTPTSELKEQFNDTPLGRDFLSIKTQKEEAETIDEVKLYWANNEQYYTKTGLLFRDYTFKINDYKVIFRIASAREELGSKKATKERFFVLDDENPIEILPSPLAGEGKGEGDIKDKSLIIRFQYRELTDKEVKHYEVEGGSNTSKQEKINQKTYDEVLKKVKDVKLRSCLVKVYKPVLRKSEGTEKPILLYQISRFTAKNTKDYFIHKNLKKFLSEQLDYFIKAEVLSIETLEKERFLDKHITRAKVVREIGEDIINFLSQIEDFQKRLWEKKKFVLKTEYVITTDRIFSLCRSDPEPSTSVIPSDSEESQSIVQGKLREGDGSPEYFYDQIWKNKEQKKEWKDLGFDVPKNKEELKKKKLPIDTRYFSQEFKERLLEALTSFPVIARDKVTKQSHDIALDDLLDGLIIKSENYQALNLLLKKYNEKIQCVYIDPPYNTGSDEFMYKDKYLHSSWISMMYDRLSLAKIFLSSNIGTIWINMDDNEIHHVSLMLNNIFGNDAFIGNIAWKKTTGDNKPIFAFTHDNIITYGKDANCSPRRAKLSKQERKAYSNPDNDPRGNWAPGDYRSKWTKTERPNLYYPIIHPKTKEEIFPDTFTNSPRVWGCSMEQHEKNLEEDLAWWGINGESKEPKKKRFLKDHTGINIRSVWEDAGTNDEASLLLRELFGQAKIYSTPKPTSLIEKIMRYSVLDGDSIFDFFAGSGTTAHAVMKLNKEEEGKRKYILVEMANYFDTVMIPRLKKICYSSNWKDGKPEDTDGVSQFFKYQILEQYEDSLDNIELTPNKTAQTLFKDDYLLKYCLDYETRGNPSLLNIEMLKNPFAYKLRVNLEEVGEPQEMVVDIPETFNYLLGLKVKRIKVRTLKGHPELVSGSKGMLKQVQHDKRYNSKYLFILGEKEGKDIAIVWREYEDNWSEVDFKRDKEFIIKELASWTPHTVYVNGQSVLTPKLGEHTVEIRYIEPEFKRLMEG